MSFLPKDVQAALDAARTGQKTSSARLTLIADGFEYPVVKMWKTGFAILLEDAPTLRGLVNLHEGGRHLFQCLIIASHAEGDEMHYDFKRATAIADAPALDFERSTSAPVALIEGPARAH